MLEITVKQSDQIVLWSEAPGDVKFPEKTPGV